jgi:multiple sugar transport system substrate-binding protein
VNRTRGRANVGFVAAVSLAAGILTSCTSSGGPNGPPPDASDPHGITVWTADTLPDRLAKTRGMLEKFASASGVTVDLVSVPAHRFSQVLTSSAASGDLPDVIGGISLGNVRTVAAGDLINVEANAKVISNLGESTWSPRSLELTRDGTQQLSVPDSSWQQLLYYRKDHFAKAGLRAPATYGDIKAAAQKLHTPQLAGFVAANKSQAFTQQSFEHIAQGNGCEMVNSKSSIAFDSPQCVGALSFYRDMLTNYSVPGIQDTDTVRAAYFAGKAAMAVWPTFMLDELAGLRSDARPNCPECKADPAFLARNTGVVTGILGSGDEPAQFGEMTSWTITKDSDTDHARQFVEYVMSDGYADWLSIAPEERLPVRAGTEANPTQFADAWRALPAGLGKKEPLSRFYPSDVLSVLLKGVDDVKHWGIIQGRGDIAGAALTELPVAKAVHDVTAGKVDPKTAAKTAAASLRSILGSLN